MVYSKIERCKQIVVMDILFKHPTKGKNINRTEYLLSEIEITILVKNLFPLLPTVVFCY